MLTCGAVASGRIASIPEVANHMPQSKSSAARLQAAERRQAVLAARRRGLTMDAIALAVGISKSRVCRIVQDALAAFAAETREETEEHRRLQLARLDGALTAIWPAVERGSLGAVDRLVKIEERRSRLLGLDAPNKIAPVSPDGKTEYQGGGLAALLAEVQRGDEQ